MASRSRWPGRAPPRPRRSRRVTGGSWLAALLWVVLGLSITNARAAPPPASEPTSREYGGTIAASPSDPPTSSPPLPPPLPTTNASTPVTTTPVTTTPLTVTEVTVSLAIYRGGDHLEGERIRRSQGAVEGTATYRLSRPATAGDHLQLLNFAESLAEEPTELDTIALSTYLDGPFNRGRMDLLDHRGALSVSRQENGQLLVLELVPGIQEVTLRYRVVVPRRYWPFGCSGRRCSLSGAIAPLPAEPAHGGRYLPPGGWVITPTRWRIAEVSFAAVPTWRPGQVPNPAEEAALRGHEIVVAADPVGERGLVSYPAVFWGPRWRRSTVTYRGIAIELLHTLWRPGDRFPNERRTQLYRDVPGHVLQALRDAIDVAAASGIEPAPGSRLLVVQGPLRSAVAETHPTALLVSDQIFQIIPVERLLEFHAEVVARGGLELLTHAFLAGRHDATTDLWLQGSLAMALLELWRVHRASRDEYASDLLSRLTFVPSVDNFLYAGQAEFTAAYFRGSEDRFPLRNHPWIAFNALPTGRRIHEKLRDLLPPLALAGFYTAVIATPDGDPIAAAESAYGRRLGWFFDQWLGPYPEVDYRIAKIDSAAVGDRWRHRITIARDSDRPLIEPVQLLVSERGGAQHHLIWNGELGPVAGSGAGLDAEPATGEHTFEIETASRLATVTIDPRARLLETPRPPKENVDPLFNNRTPPGVRFLYTGFGLNLAISEFLTATNPAARLGALSGFASFEASRRRDLRASGHFVVYRDRETSAGLGGGVNLWVGEKRNLRRRVGRFRLFGNVEWLTDQGLDPRGGLRLTELFAYVHDTRRFTLWPDRGRRIFGLLQGSQILRVDGLEDDHRYSLTAEAGWIELWPLAHRHVLASRIEGSMMIPLGSEPEFRNLLRGGGIGELSAYGGNELFGRAILKGQVEYRHTFYDNLAINVAHLAWLRGIGGTLFAGASTISSCDDYSGLFRQESWYGQVGYGLTGFLRVLGVTPQFIRLDLSVPLVRRQSLCLGRRLPGYLAEQQGIEDPQVLLPPVTVNLTFLQPF